MKEKAHVACPQFLFKRGSSPGNVSTEPQKASPIPLKLLKSRKIVFEDIDSDSDMDSPCPSNHRSGLMLHWDNLKTLVKRLTGQNCREKLTQKEQPLKSKVKNAYHAQFSFEEVIPSIVSYETPKTPYRSLLFTSPVLKSQRITFFLQVDDKVSVLDILPQDYVGQIFQFARIISGLNPSQIKLFFGTCYLDKEKRVLDYNICSGSTIFLYCPIIGGGGQGSGRTKNSGPKKEKKKETQIHNAAAPSNLVQNGLLSLQVEITLSMNSLEKMKQL